MRGKTPYGATNLTTNPHTAMTTRPNAKRRAGRLVLWWLCYCRGAGVAHAFGLGNNIVQATGHGGIGCMNPLRWAPLDAENEPSSFSDATADEYGRAWRACAAFLRASLRSLGVEPDAAFARTAVVHLRCSDVPFTRNPE